MKPHALHPEADAEYEEAVRHYASITPELGIPEVSRAMRTDKNGPIGAIGMDGWDGSSGKFASLQLLSRFEARRETGLLPEIRSASLTGLATGVR